MNKFYFILLIFFIGFTSSCKVLKKTKNTELSDENKFKFEYSFAEAGKQRMLGNDQDAIDMYMYCIELNPKSAASNYFISMLYAKNDNLQTALAFAENSVKLNDKKIWYKILMVDILTIQSKYEEAEKIYLQIIKTNSEIKHIYYDLISIYVKQKKLEKAVNIYQKLQDKFTYEESNALAIYDLLMNLNKKSKALDELKKLKKYFPENIKYKALIAEYYLRTRNMKKAKILYDEMLSEAPNNISVRLSYISYSKFINDKKAFYESSLFVIKSYEVEFSTKLKIIFAGEKKMFSKEQYLNIINNLMIMHPEERASHTLYAEILLGQGKKNEAAKEIRKSVSIDNSYFNLALALFEIDYEINDFENLYTDTEKLKEIYPNQAKLFFYNGLASFHLKDYENAEKTLNYGKDLIIDDNFLSARYYFYLGEVYNNKKEKTKSNINFEKALKYIEIAAKNIPNNSKIFEHYGDVLFRNKKIDDAVIQWKKAYKLNNSKELENKIKTKKL